MTLETAKTQLIILHPFFASLALNCQFIEDRTIPTACTNGDWIKYNPDWLCKMPVDEQIFVIAHECLHKGLFHHTRRNDRDPRKWNVACDYPINEILVESGFKMPSGENAGLLDKKYYGKSADEVYNLLEDKDFPKMQGMGEVVDSDKEQGEAEMQTKMQLAAAAELARQAGKLPAHLERLVGSLLETKVNWRDILIRFITEKAYSDYTWTKPNPRLMSMGTYLPKLESQETGEIILIVDTSGSIDGELLNEFATEMYEVCKFTSKELLVIYVDTRVHAPEYIEDGLQLHPKGGGGTDFKPGFDYIEKEEKTPAAVIYFTDGFCDSYPNTPDYPVLWTVYKNETFNPPFGEVIHLN